MMRLAHSITKSEAIDMKTRVAPARKALIFCALFAPLYTGGCSGIAGEFSDKIAGRSPLPQMQAQQAPEAQASYLQRRRPMNNPPTDGDPRYTGDNVRSMQQMPAMQAGSEQAGYPMGLPPAPQTPAAAWQGGANVQNAPAAGFMPDPNAPVPASGLDPYAAQQQQMQQGMPGQGMPAAGYGGGAPASAFPPAQAPYAPPSPAYGGQQGMAYPQTGAPYPAPAQGGGYTGASYAPQETAPGPTNASYAPAAQTVPGGPTGGNYGGGFDSAAGSMPLQLDGGEVIARGDGGAPRGPALQSYGAQTGAPWDSYNGDGQAADPYGAKGAAPTAAASNQVQDIPYAPRQGGQQAAGTDLLPGQNPLAAKSRLRYATRNRTSYYQSMMSQRIDMPSPYNTPGAEMSY